jgi:signal transduction histidine kinase/CheY-like chemotaxis protein
VAESGDGAIWTGHQRPFVTRWKDDAFETYSTRDGVPGGTVDLLLPQGDDVWIGTAAGLGRWHAGTIEPVTWPDGSAIRGIRDGATDGGVVWLATGSGVVRLDDAGARRIEAQRPGKPRLTETVCADGEGNVWIGRTDGVLIWNGERFIDVPMDGIGAVESIARREDTVWLTAGRSVFGLGNAAEVTRGDPPEWLPPLDERFQLPTSVLLQDREGNLWMGTAGQGLARISRALVTRYDTRDGLPASEIHALTGGPDGDLWMSLNCNGLAHWRDGRIEPVPLPINACIGALLVDDADRLWLSTLGGVECHAPDGTVTRYDVPVADGSSVCYLGQAPDGAVWACGARADDGLFRLGPSGFEPVPWWDQVRTEVVSITWDDRGRQWLAGVGAVFVVKGDVVTRYDETDGIPPGQVRDILVTDDGVAWIGSYGGGLTRLAGDGVTRFSTREGLAENVVSRILQDHRDDLWMLGNLGIYFVERAQLDAFAAGERDQVDCVTFGPRDGVPEGNGIAQPAGYQTPDGRLWFSTLEGAVVIDPSRIPSGGPAPPVIIEAARIGRETVDIRDGLVVPAGNRDLEIDFTAASFTRPESVEFRVRLDGRDDDWVRIGRRRTAYYGDLRPGEYVLRVMARNDVGEWTGDGATLAITIEPHFYETGWFLFTSITALACLIVFIHRGRVRAMAAHNRALVNEIETRKRAEQDRARLEQELAHAQKMEAVGQLAGGAAHDFNNLLMLIRGHAELLEYARDQNATRKSIAQIVRASHRGAELTAQLLALSRKTVWKPRVVAVNDVLRGMTQMFERILGEEVTCRSSLDPDTGHVKVDPGQFEQVILNLVVNARDAMSGNGTLTIATEEARSNGESGLPAGDYARIRISDSGCGIPPEVLPRIFDPFFTTKPTGTGLGLSTAYGIVRQAQGSIAAESEPHEGTTFTILLPVTPEPRTDDRDDTPKETGPVAPARILVVEDDRSVREFIALSLREDGHTVFEAADGLEALRSMDGMTAPADLVVTDVIMPRMGGVELATRMRGELPGLPFLFISGYADRAARLLSELPAHSSFLAKPFGPGELRSQVIEILAREGAGSAASPRARPTP